MKPRQMMGFESDSDARVSLAVRDVNAMKLAIWRCKVGFEIIGKTASEMVAPKSSDDEFATHFFRHSDGCPGAESETEPCLASCPDREQRMSVLVMLNAAKMLAPVDARMPAAAFYMAPSREYYSEVIAELAATQIALDAAHAELRKLGAEIPSPPPNKTPARLVPPTVKYFSLPEVSPDAPPEEELEPIRRPQQQ